MRKFFAAFRGFAPLPLCALVLNAYRNPPAFRMKLLISPSAASVTYKSLM
jgi:hypothetical protein